MRPIYFDNAATTYMYDEVIDVISDAMKSNFGNPSSTHQFGRKAKVALEKARKSIASVFGVASSEIIFTSSGTEGNNLVLNNAVKNLGVKRIITSKIEHHAVLNVVENLEKENNLEVKYVSLDDKGIIDLNELETLLSEDNDRTLVSLMMVNNEIGNVLPYEKVSKLCNQYNALFHTDAVQAVGHLDIDLKKNVIDFLVASAHKFHGPKGVGFVYSKKNHVMKPMLLGGNQERGVRSSTENIPGILGMEKALLMSVNSLKDREEYINRIKSYFCEKIKEVIPETDFNGLSSLKEKAVPKILNVRFPIQDKMLLFNLDIKGIAASSGSACQSGGVKVSHVLKEILPFDELQKTSIRFSFSFSSTQEEIDQVISVIYSYLNINRF